VDCQGFQRDSGNTDKIWDRHGVTPAECEELFLNRPMVVGTDAQRSSGEDRLYALGQSDSGRLIFVVFTIRVRVIRVISARDMSRKKRRVYQSS
jgi:uncharacterized protein